MEKPGMDRRRKPAGAGLLAFFFLLAPAFSGAQNPPGELRVLAETAPERPVSGGFWTLTLLVDCPRPGEVEIRPPPFPPALSLDSVRREPRLLGNERWTAVEYRFILRGSGPLSLAPFEILSPRGRAFSAPLSLEIRAAGGEIRPRLVWENIPPRLVVGETRELCLRIMDWDPQRPLPAPALFLPEVPRGVILEALAPRPGDGEAGRALRLRLIPLAGGRFELPGKTLRSGDLLLEIPPLSIPVSGEGPS
jgi:hypothetical protein